MDKQRSVWRALFPFGGGGAWGHSAMLRHLSPTESLSEALFGLIMVLTFTVGAGLIIKEGKEATRQMLVGILGCNIAWGLIDGAMYIMNCLFERSRKTRLLEKIQETGDEGYALSVIGDEFDEVLEPLTAPDERDRLYRAVHKRLKNLSPERTRVKKEDLYVALACFWLVFLTTIPAVIPFLVFENRFVALRASNVLLLAMLFWVGFRWARATHGNPWVFGSALLLLGLVLVGIAIPLGG
jgi:hypothetical protein